METGDPNWSTQGHCKDLSVFKEAAALGTPLDTLQCLYPKVFKKYPGVVQEFVVSKRFEYNEDEKAHRESIVKATLEKQNKKFR